MNQADRQILRGLDKLQPEDAIARLAQVVESLCQRVETLDQQIKAVMEQQGMQTADLRTVTEGLKGLVDELIPVAADSTFFVPALKVPARSGTCGNGCYGKNIAFDCQVHRGVREVA